MARRKKLHRGASIRVLVVEDEPSYRLKLKKMYERLFQDRNPEVETSATAQEAMDALLEKRFHLLHLDLNLIGTTGASIQRNAHAWDVLDRARQKQVRGVVIFTAAPMDEQYRYISKQLGYDERWGTLREHARELFGEAVNFTPKDPNVSDEENIQALFHSLHSDRIMDICSPVKPSLSPDYTVEVEIGERLVVSIRGARGGRIVLDDAQDYLHANILYHLARVNKDEGIFVTKEEIANILAEFRMEEYSRRFSNRRRTLRWSPFFGQVGKLKSLRRSEEEERWRSANSTVGNSRRRWCCRL